ncbi:hypothetical protein MBLNU230_g2215t1 [Neophaeotheca triangularis]
MPPKVMTWDAAADRKFFLLIIKTNNVTLDYDSLARQMSTADMTVTTSALKSRFKKLKKMAKEGSSEDGDDKATPTTTPSKRKKGDGDEATPSKKLKSAAKAKSKAKAQEMEGGDDDEEDDTVGRFAEGQVYVKEESPF